MAPQAQHSDMVHCKAFNVGDSNNHFTYVTNPQGTSTITSNAQITEEKWWASLIWGEKIETNLIEFNQITTLEYSTSMR